MKTWDRHKRPLLMRVAMDAVDEAGVQIEALMNSIGAPARGNTELHQILDEMQKARTALELLKDFQPFND